MFLRNVYFSAMKIPPNMTEVELKKIIDKGEQFLYEPGELYNELIEAGYPKEKIDVMISAKRKKESKFFKTIALFTAIVLIYIGLTTIGEYIGKSLLGLLIGVILCIIAFLAIKRVFSES